jgi:hypothetical protein
MTIRSLSFVRYATFGTMMLGISAIINARPPINLFRPSDRFLMPEPLIPCWGGQLSIGYEGAIHTRGFRDDGDDSLQAHIHASRDIKRKTNVLEIYQRNQNALAALKGFDSETEEGQLSQWFNINDDNGTQGLFRPTGHLSIPLNLLLSQRFYFDHGLSFALHLPIIHMELKDVRFQRLHEARTEEQELAEDLLERIRQRAGLNTQGWKRTGIGDLVAQMTWMRDFPQIKPALTNVRVQARLGVDFPTGKVRDEDRLLALPFGNDGAWGLQFGGGIDLTFCWTLRAGLDAEFLYLFPNTRCRRIKTVCDQTDLLFLTKVPVLREFGLNQQFNIYLESCNFWRGLSAKINYQLLKQNDDRIDVGSDLIDPTIVNSAESLQEWTAHSLIFSLRYDLWKDLPDAPVLPSIMGWFKWGFNGKRAILANTLGLQLSLAF